MIAPAIATTFVEMEIIHYIHRIGIPWRKSRQFTIKVKEPSNNDKTLKDLTGIIIAW